MVRTIHSLVVGHSDVWGNDVTPAAINLNDDNITDSFWCCSLWWCMLIHHVWAAAALHEQVTELTQHLNLETKHFNGQVW